MAALPQAQPVAALYCRVSTKGQEEDGSSLDTQEASCRNHAAALGYAVDDRLVFRETWSGGDLWERPRLVKLREAIRGGAVDALICHAVDRLSRDQVHLAILLDECERAGVRLLFATEEFDQSPVGKFILSAKGFAAEVERQKIKERSKRGIRARFESGKPYGGGFVLFGYRWRDEQKTGYEIDERTAPVVRRIFALAAEGQSLRAIAHMVNAEGVPTPRGRPHWVHTSVRTVLTQEAYTGVGRAHKVEQRKVNGKYTRRERALDEQVVLPEGCYPPLVDTVTFAAVQERLRRNQETASRRAAEPERFLLRGGYVHCGYCGHTLSAVMHKEKNGGRYPLYEASKGASHERCGERFTISAAELDRTVWEKVEAVLLRPEIIEREIARLRQTDPTEGDLRTVDRLLAEATRKQGNLTRLLADLDDPDASAPLLAELKALAASKRRYEEEREALLDRRAGWQAAQERLDTIERWRQSIAARLGTFDYRQKRLALDALRVEVKLYRRDHTPRYHITAIIPLDAPRSSDRTSLSAESCSHSPHRSAPSRFVYRTPGRICRRGCPRRSAGRSA